MTSNFFELTGVSFISGLFNGGKYLPIIVYSVYHGLHVALFPPNTYSIIFSPERSDLLQVGVYDSRNSRNPGDR